MLGEVKGSEFLKKIFPLEICLPALDKDAIPKFLNNELQEYIDSKENDILAKIKADINIQQIQVYLPTFRDVKRFVSQFCLNLNSFIRSNQINEINVIDFFYVELLQYYDFDAYQFVRDDLFSTPLIEYGLNNRKYAIKYIDLERSKVNKSLDEKKEYRPEILEKYKDGVHYILNKLFGERNDDPTNSIKYLANYEKYFSYRINSYVISIQEYNDFVNISDKKEVKEKIKLFCEGEVSKARSLWFHSLSNELDKANRQQVYNVAYTLMKLRHYRHYDVASIFKTLFEKNKYRNSETIAKALEDAIKDYIREDNCKHGVIQNMLTSLVSEGYYDDDSEYHSQYEAVVSNESLKSLAEENLRRILEQKEEHIPIELITDDTSPLCKFLKTAVAKVTTYSPDGEHYIVEKISLVIGGLKEYYITTNNESSLELFFKQLDPFKDDPYCYAYDEQSKEIVKDHIERVFGNIKDFKDFISAVFRNSDKVNEELKWLCLDEIKTGVQ